MPDKIKSLLLIIRPANFLISFFSVLVAVLVSQTEQLPVYKLLCAALAGSLTASAGNVINDIFDIEIDRINRPARILPSGKLSSSTAMFYYFILNFFALFFALFLNIPAALIVVFSILTLYIYSAYLKKIILLGNITVAALTALAFIFGGVAAGSIQNSLIPAGFAFLINFIREIIKDIEDLKGDSRYRIITFSGRYGVDSAKKLAAAAGFFLIILTFVPFILKLYKIEYFLIVLLTVDLLLVLFLKSLFLNDQGNKWSRLSSILKLSMIFGLAAIFFGK